MPDDMLTEHGHIRRHCMRRKSVAFQKKHLLLENKEADNDENRHRQQLGSGWKRTLHDIQRLFLLPTFIFYTHFCFGQGGEKAAKFYSRLENTADRSQKVHNFWPFAHFLPTFKIKSGHGLQLKYSDNTLYFYAKMPFCPLAHFFS